MMDRYVSQRYDQNPSRRDANPVPSITGHDVDANQVFLPRRDTFPVHLQRQPDPPIISNESKTLADLLRESMERDSVTNHAYMPLHVVRKIMTREVVLRELKTHPQVAQSAGLLNRIRPEDATVSTEHIYTKIFAVLARVGKCGDIERFVRESLSDDKLPFFREGECGNHVDRASFQLFVKETSGISRKIEACGSWTADERERFYERQENFMVHSFKQRPDRAGHDLSSEKPSWVEELHDLTYLPWKKQTVTKRKEDSDYGNSWSIPTNTKSNLRPSVTSQGGSQVGRSHASGAYGSVDPYQIDDKDHNFKRLLQRVSHSVMYFSPTLISLMTYTTCMLTNCIKGRTQRRNFRCEKTAAAD